MKQVNKILQSTLVICLLGVASMGYGQEFPPTITAINPQAVREGDTVNLKAEINDPDSDTFTFTWRMPDGSVSNLTQPEFKATTPGANYVQLVVQDAEGNKSFPYSEVINVRNLPPKVLSISPSKAQHDQGINFSAEVDYMGPDYLTKYNWTLPDGSNRNGPNPSFVFFRPGAYQVKLKVEERLLEVIYSNNRQYGDAPAFYPVEEECGDEVVFGGRSRFLQRFEFVYYGHFDDMDEAQKGNVTAVVRFYKNDGPPWKKIKNSKMPHTLIYESKPFKVFEGYNWKTLNYLAQPVPDRLTWTVEFKGIPQLYGKQAGLVFYNSDPKTQYDVGTSFDDFWAKREGDTWEPMRMGGKPIANFGMQAQGISDIVLKGSQEFVSTVIVKNDPPEIVAFNVPRKGEAKKAMTFSAAAVDGEQPLLTYEWDMGDGKILTGKSVEYTYRSKAKYTVTLTVTDEMGASASQSAVVKVFNERIYYEFTSVAELNASKGRLYEYNITTRSLLPPVPGDLLKIKITASRIPDWLKVEDNDNKGSAVLRGTPTLEDLGVHIIELNLTDGQFGSRQLFAIQVLDDNNPPVVSELVDREIMNLWPEETLGVFSAFDRDPGDEVVLTIESSNHDVLPPEGMELEKMGSAWRLLGTFVEGVSGETTITVTGSDGDKSTSRSCLITVVGPDLFTIQLDESVGGKILLSPDQEDYLEDQMVEVIAKPAKGYVFQNWTGDSDATANHFTFHINKDTKFGAVFANPKPEIVSINLPTKVFKGEAASLGTVVEDANGDELTLAWTLGDGTKASGRSVTHTYNREGTFTLTLTVTDSAGQADTKSASIEVTVDRKALRFTGQFDLIGFENEPFEGEVTTIAPGAGQLLDLAVLKQPDWVKFTDNGDGTGQFAGNPTTADVGNHEVIMELTDGKQKVTQPYTLEIIDFPEPPVIAAITDQQGVNIREIGPIVVDASDPDLDSTLAFSVKSSENNVAHPNRIRFVLTEEGERHLYIVPNRDATGSTTITVTVSDGEHEASVSFTLTTREPERYSLDLAQVDGGVISVTPASENFVEQSVVTVNALPAKGYIFDGWTGVLEGTETPATLVMDANKAVGAQFSNPVPQIIAINLPTKALAKKPASFNATVSDIDDENLTLSWELGDGTTKTGDTITHTYQTSGEYSVTLTVTDSNGAKAAGTALLEVDDDFALLQFTSAPVVEVLEGETYAYSVATVKAGTGQVLKIEATTKPDWVSFKDNGDGTAALTGSPLNDQVGFHPVELVLSDQRGSVAQAFSIEVVNVNQAPSISAIEDAVIRRDTTLGPVSFTVSDPDKGDQLKVTASSTDQDLLPDDTILLEEVEAGWTLNASPTAGTIGVTTITVTVSDGTVDVKESFLLTVEPPPIHTVTLTQPKGGTITIEPEGTKFEEGTIVRLTAEPSGGYEFGNWTGSVDSIENPIVLPIDKPMDVGAQMQDIAPPVITITSPTPGPVIDQVLSIVGRVTDNDQLASYQWYRGDTLQGSLNPDASGNFTIGGLELKEGKNPFKITAKDASGNEASEAFVVNWSARTVLTVLDGKTTVEGKVVSFPVMLKSEGKVGGITFKLVYNPTFMGDPVFEWASLFGLSINSVNADTPGEVVATFAFSGQAVPKGIQQVGTLKLRVRSMPFGMETLIEPEIIEVSDSLGDSLEGGLVSQIGAARINPRRIKGDINGNERYDVGDASLIQELIVKGIEPLRSWDLSLNDLNNNNKLDSGDVIRILRVVVGFEKQPKADKGNDGGGDKTHWELTHHLVRPVAKSGPDGPTAEITSPDLSDLKPGQVVEVAVSLDGVTDQFRGVSFNLHFPEDLMIPQNGLFSYKPGDIVPQSALKIWNPENEERGSVSFAASQEEPWTLKNGSVSKITFVVRDLIAPQSSWSMAVTDLEISYNGYENSILETGFSELKTGNLHPKPGFAEFGFQNGDIAVVVDGTGGNLLVEYSDDFADWYPLITIPNTKGIIQFNDPSSLEALMRFYRLKSFVRPTAPPKWTLEPGFGGERGNEGGGSNPLPPLKIGPILPGP